MPKYNTKIIDGVTYYRKRGTYNGVKYDLTALSEKEIENKLRNKERYIDEQTVLNNPNVTVGAWSKEWLETYKKPDIVDESYKLYKRNIENHILPEIGKMKLRDVQHAHLQKILNAQAQIYGKSHVGHVKDAITGMFSKAIQNRIISFNPANNLSIPKSTTSGTHRCLTKEEEIAFLAVCENHYAGLFGLLMYYCGLRPGECAALKWDDIDFDKKTIHITKAIGSGTRETKNPKTFAGVRDVPVPKKLEDKLKKIKSNGYLLKTKDGQILNNYNRCVWFRSLKRATNIQMGAKLYRNKIIEYKTLEPFTAYCIRHTYCTNLQRAGIPLNVAKNFMGHNDIKITASIYTHQTDDQSEKAAKMIDSFLCRDDKNGE